MDSIDRRAAGAGAVLLSIALAAACSPTQRTYGAGGSTSSSSSSSGTTQTTTSSCVPEPDAAFCAAQASACESVTAADNCGMTRTADCGACAAPLACVKGTCKTPVCSGVAALASATPTDITSACLAAVQDVPEAMTPTASTIIVLHGTPCGPSFEPYVADETSPGSLTYNTQPLPGITGMDLTGEEQATLTADGLTVIGVDPMHQTFLQSTRSAPGAVDFGPADGTPFTNLTVTSPQQIGYPYITADGLALYYLIQGDPSAAVNGIYEAVRPSTSDPFAAGARMGDDVQAGHYVTGCSSDRMTLFVQDNNFGTFVLSRTSVTQPFTNPNAPSAPPTVPGFRIQPLQDCSALIGSCHSGCSNEKICEYK